MFCLFGDFVFCETNIRKKAFENLHDFLLCEVCVFNTFVTKSQFFIQKHDNSRGEECMFCFLAKPKGKNSQHRRQELRTARTNVECRISSGKLYQICRFWKNFLMEGGRIFLGNGTVPFLFSDNSEEAVDQYYDFCYT